MMYRSRSPVAHRTPVMSALASPPETPPSDAAAWETRART